MIVDLHAQMNALQAYVGYLLKTLWPMKLAVLYPFAESRLTPLRTGGAALILLAITIAVLAQRRRRPYLLVGWLWYLGTLVPVIGIFRIGYHAMADRYTYLPHIGLFIMVSWGLAELAADSVPVRRAAAAAVIIVASLLCLLTYKQVRHWENTITPIVAWLGPPHPTMAFFPPSTPFTLLQIFLTHAEKTCNKFHVK